MFDTLPLVILDDAAYVALFSPRRVSLRGIVLLSVMLLSFAGALCGSESSRWGCDVLVMGLSRHSARYNTDAGDGVPGTRMHEANPGIGLGLTREVGVSSEDWRADALLTAGTYVDSYTERARFVMVGMRWTYRDRLCADLSGGFYRGSGFDGLGVVPTLGVRVAGPVWLHVTGTPATVTGTSKGEDGEACSFVALFARVHWGF